MILTKQTIQTLVDIRNPKKPAQFIKNYVDKQLNRVKVGLENEIEDLQQLGESTNAKVDTRSKSKATRADGRR